MKSANHIFTRMRLGIDLRVWLVMLSLLFISVFILGFKIMSDNRIACSDYQITPIATTAGKANSFYIGQSIVFGATVQPGSNLAWDFGDGTPIVKGNNIKHSFLHQANYAVTATLNGTCVESVSVDIEELISKPVVTIAPAARKDVIAGTDTPHVGETAVYLSTLAADTYEWSVLNSSYPVITGSKANYKFLTPGSRILVLKLNGDNNSVYRDTITVMPSLSPKAATVAEIEKTPPKVLALPPRIASFYPPGGGTGTTVTINGNNFNNATSVSFGGTAAASFMVMSPTAISATVGAGASGNISVTTNNGKNISQQVFAYTAPVAAPAVAPTPAKSKIMIISNEEFKRLFQQVCDGQADVSVFNSYLCQGSDTKVLLPDGKFKSVKDFCDMLKSKKKVLGVVVGKYTIKSVKATRDQANQNCVMVLDVNYK